MLGFWKRKQTNKQTNKKKKMVKLLALHASLGGVRLNPEIAHCFPL